MAETLPLYPEWIDGDLAAYSIIVGIVSGAIAGSTFPAELQPYAILTTVIVGLYFTYPIMHIMTARKWVKPEGYDD